MLPRSTSEVAHILQRIQQEYQASQRGLEGLASGTTRHDFISAKAENSGRCHEQLAKW